MANVKINVSEKALTELIRNKVACNGLLTIREGEKESAWRADLVLSSGFKPRNLFTDLQTINLGHFFFFEQVRYVPQHAKDDPYHKDCETGYVLECNESTARVLYIRNGILQKTSQVTERRLLRSWR